MRRYLVNLFLQAFRLVVEPGLLCLSVLNKGREITHCLAEAIIHLPLLRLGIFQLSCRLKKGTPVR